MAKTKTDVKAFDEFETTNYVFDNARKIGLMGMGAVTMIQDETTNLFNNLVERGGKIEKKGQEQVRKVAKMPGKQVDKVTKQVNDTVNKGIETVLGGLNIPTRSDVKTLNSRISTLSRKVDELKKN